MCEQLSAEINKLTNDFRLWCLEKADYIKEGTEITMCITRLISTINLDTFDYRKTASYLFSGYKIIPYTFTYVGNFNARDKLQIELKREGVWDYSISDFDVIFANPFNILLTPKYFTEFAFENYSHKTRIPVSQLQYYYLDQISKYKNVPLEIQAQAPFNIAVCRSNPAINLTHIKEINGACEYDYNEIQLINAPSKYLLLFCANVDEIKAKKITDGNWKKVLKFVTNEKIKENGFSDGVYYIAHNDKNGIVDYLLSQ